MMTVTIGEAINHGFWGGIVVFVVVLGYRITKIVQEQQKQIDTLTRELEEVKRKLEK